MSPVQIFTRSNIDTYDDLQDFHCELSYILPFCNGMASEYIANVETEAGLLRAGKYLFPVTINNEDYDCSYVCSPYNACILYSKEEIPKIGNIILETFLNCIVTAFSMILRSANINKVVSVNNWLLSTNLYPEWQGENIKEITELFIKNYKDHAIMFRSLNHHSNADLIENLTQNDYCLVPSRQVYIFDKKISAYHKKPDMKRDLKLLTNTAYTIVEHQDLTSMDYSRIVDLYNKLYLEKYTYHNPQFTKKYIELCHKKKLMTMIGLRNNKGQLDGIVSCFERGGVVSAPLVGYDTDLPKSLGLYRMLLALVVKRAHANDMKLNLSSGASEFKRLRGGIPYIEYSAIHIKHLQLWRRFVWLALTWTLNKIGVPIMKMYKL